jgi:hypothetical protein
MKIAVGPKISRLRSALGDDNSSGAFCQPAPGRKPAGSLKKQKALDKNRPFS